MGPTWVVLTLPFLEGGNYVALYNSKAPLDDPSNQAFATQQIGELICPSDPQGANPILTNRAGGYHNPPSVMGLWYPGSMGPTHPDACPFCPNPSAAPNNYCCQGNNFGAASPEGNGVGLFMRYPRPIKFREVTDGLSKTLLLGETLPGDCVWNGAFDTNFPCNPTTIPLNTFTSDNGVAANWYYHCGFKSKHPGGASFAMGDGSVHFLSELIDYRLYNNLGTRAGGESIEFPPP